MAARGREKNSVILRLLQENVITVIIAIIQGCLELTAKHDWVNWQRSYTQRHRDRINQRDTLMLWRPGELDRTG